MLVAVGLTTSDLSSLDHGEVIISSSGSFEVFQSGKANDCQSILDTPIQKAADPSFRIAPGSRLTLKQTKNGVELFENKKRLICKDGVIVIKPASHSQRLHIETIKRASAKGSVGASYQGTLVVYSLRGHLRVSLVVELDQYLAGVLQSEIPGSYHLEAVKAQAVAARTYGLNPRINHSKDLVNVCDSYMCCQYFGGLTSLASGTHRAAIDATLGQILVFEDKPILALFSSNAGGHTENYENCFSDPESGQFPPAKLPYLTGVFESKSKQTVNLQDEGQFVAFYRSAPNTVDAWSPHFKWQVHLTADELEAHMHATVQAMLKDERAPFVVAPSSGKFGLIESISVLRRGVSGCAIEIEVKTSHGAWRISKELVIRDLFKTPEKKIARLKSARIFFNNKLDSRSHLTELSICGLGWGHGVGLQQTGAQGWAKSGSNYRSILAHYFQGASIDKV